MNQSSRSITAHATRLGFIALVIVATGGVAFADCPRPHGPPQEAFDACAQSKAGDACTVTFDGHDVHGTCAAFPGSDQLACRPDGPPPGPPPAAPGG